MKQTRIVYSMVIYLVRYYSSTLDLKFAAFCDCFQSCNILITFVIFRSNPISACIFSLTRQTSKQTNKQIQVYIFGLVYITLHQSILKHKNFHLTTY